MTKHNYPAVLTKRRSGVLLHPSSLPGDSETGELGPEAFHFVDFLVNCGVSVWQMLPLVPTHSDKSPYMGLSVLAGNPDLVSISLLQTWGWLEAESKLQLNTKNGQAKHELIKKAHQGFKLKATDDDRSEFDQFLTTNHDWLEDYALFQALRHRFKQQSWTQWPQALRDREVSALKQAKQDCGVAINDIIFEQFVFFKQWHSLKQYANERDVYLFGDMPIFVAHDSAEVWSNRDQFDLLADGSPRMVAGVPPDYFSETGQLWGNPHYKWKQMREDHFQWWIQRVKNGLHMYDLIRIDHFRGFEAFWEIKNNEETAMNGRWVKAPGKALFSALYDAFEHVPFVAEDLGVITPEVEALRDRFGWPGMKILQFAFDGNVENPYLPHNYNKNCVVYSGTHDNDTSYSWYRQLPEETQQQVDAYLDATDTKLTPKQVPWRLIRVAIASTANLAVIPMQDILSLGNGSRMNTPGKKQGNWKWRFQWDQVSEDMPARLMSLNKRFGRANHSR